MQTHDNVVLITGGSSGIGLALAKWFLSEKNHVIIVGRSQEKLSSVKADYPDIIIEQADITNEDAIKALATKYTNVNILINNAGIHHEFDFKNAGNDDIAILQEISTNLVAPILLAKYFAPVLQSQKSSAIVNISSYFGISPKPSAPVYSATKAAIRSLSKSLRTQFENTSVRVFDIAPPIVDTPMTKNSNNKNTRKMKVEDLTEVFWKAFSKDRYEVYPGLSKLFYILNRLHPRYLENKIKKVTQRL